MSTINYPKVGQTKDQKVYVSFYINNKKIRLFNGKRINSNLNPNDFPIDQRLALANVLAAEVYKYITEGGVLRQYRSQVVEVGKVSDLEYLKLALQSKLSGNYSSHYKKTLQYVFKHLTKDLRGDEMSVEVVEAFLNKYSCATSYNTIRRHLNVLINEAINQGMVRDGLPLKRSRKAKAKLNKPFKDIPIILKAIEEFNYNLYLCCLMTYGCLLRPHREIRELTWGDFTEDLAYIKLSGLRNKSGRNRIVPVPSYIRERLCVGAPNENIFSGTDKPYGSEYFKTLWGRFKAQSNLLEQDQTLYSFRHSGAIEIFKRTGSLTKLQKAMGHSSLNVSLTYLRGLEVAELTEEDMPMVY
jgi:integrase